MFNHEEYDAYIVDHRNNVQKAYEFCLANNIFPYNDKTAEAVKNHDLSKYSDEEYNAYGEYFYGDKRNVPHKEDMDFKRAWLHHQHNNPHHWQYWLLKEDEGTGLEALEIPEEYAQEMICDWLSFAIKAKNINNFFSWYAENKPKQILHPNTRIWVEEIIKKISDAGFLF